jgi:hypothetical protein
VNRKPRKAASDRIWRAVFGFLTPAGAALVLSLIPGWHFRTDAAESASTLRPWPDYRTILWTGDTPYKTPEKLPLFFKRLGEMGINTAMVGGDGDPKPALENKYRYYVENMVNRGLCLKWNSKVSNWDKFVTAWVKDGRPDSALVRDYCLDDPQWLGWAENEMRRQAQKYRGDEPVAYDIRDELSTTISANPFDYDFNPITLAKFREWLKTQYVDLAALNSEWETQYENWDSVRPFTTDRIKSRMGSGLAEPRGKPNWAEVQALKFDWSRARQSRTQWNFSPWADFRTYMDISLARGLGRMRAAAHQADPRTPVGIEGTQMPHAFGGYDLWRLSQALDWVEPYDIANAREIFGSFMPGPLMTTVFEKETNAARRRLWHLLLEGDGGCIVWWSEDCIDWKSADWPLTPKARVLAPVLKEMTSPLARLFLRAQREQDPILIHYSQPSIQAAWLMESTADGSTWVRRFSSYEAGHNRMAKVRNGWVKLFQDLGYSPKFVASEQIEAGTLQHLTNAVLVLPSSWAVSDQEASEMQRFIRSPGQARAVFADGTPAVFDHHCRLRAENPLGAWFGTHDLSATCVGGKSSQAGTIRTDLASYPAERLRARSEESLLGRWAAEQLRSLPPPIKVPESARVRVHRFHTPKAQLVAFERNINYQMSEDQKQAGGNEALEQPVRLEAFLPHQQHVYDLRSGKYLGALQKLEFLLDPWQPSLFALTSAKLETTDVVAALLE